MDRGTSEKIKQTLKKHHSCYVLITCDEASDEGVMQVEMSYEGDPTLAALLLQNAHSVMEQKVDEEAGLGREETDKIEPLSCASKMRLEN